MDPKLSPGLCIATKCSIVDPLGPLSYMSAKFFISLQPDNLKSPISNQNKFFTFSHLEKNFNQLGKNNHIV